MDAASGGSAFQNNNLVQAWLVLLLAIVFGGSLAGIQLGLGPRIRQNKLNETLAKVPDLVVSQSRLAALKETGESLSIEAETVGVEKPGGRRSWYSVYKANYPDGSPAGFVVKTAGRGYADKIELLVGLNPTVKTITGIFILEQKETPGLGNKIIHPAWRGQFRDKPTDTPLNVVKKKAEAKNEIDAVTGATISSKSVVDIVNRAVTDLHGELN